jgi:hypothetical protein
MLICVDTKIRVGGKESPLVRVTGWQYLAVKLPMCDE